MAFMNYSTATRRSGADIAEHPQERVFHEKYPMALVNNSTAMQTRRQTVADHPQEGIFQEKYPWRW
jgi:hypothetical protein